MFNFPLWYMLVIIALSIHGMKCTRYRYNETESYNAMETATDTVNSRESRPTTLRISPTLTLADSSAASVSPRWTNSPT